MSVTKDGTISTAFLYDAFGRCLLVTDVLGTKQLIYQKDHEIGSIVNNRLQEFRLIHPEHPEITLATELDYEPFFPIQDFRGNICALQKRDGTLAQWYRYTTFGETKIFGDLQLYNPWCFANRREVGDLILFKHRFYYPKLMRWLTRDPAGYIDGLNLYQYTHGNPFYYIDQDGRFAIALGIPFGQTIGAAILSFIVEGVAVATAPAWVPAALGARALVALGYTGYKVYDRYFAVNQINVDEENEKLIEEEKEEKEKRSKPPVRTEPRNLEEQLTLEEAKNNPTRKDGEIMEGKIKDPNFPQVDWKKCSHVHKYVDGTNTEIHYWENRHTGEKKDFKFKDK